MILIIDDELREMSSYSLELELSGYGVLCKNDVDEAWLYFENNSSQIELCILDIRLPSGSMFRNTDTKQGLRTGISFYRKLREVSAECPVIILTNTLDSLVSEEFTQEKRCAYLQKSDYLPFELVEVVRSILRSSINAA